MTDIAQTIAELQAKLAAAKEAQQQEREAIVANRPSSKAARREAATIARRERQKVRDQRAKAARAQRRADKIARSKLDGSFERKTRAAENSRNYRKSRAYRDSQDRKKTEASLKKAEQKRLELLLEKFTRPSLEGTNAVDSPKDQTPHGPDTRTAADIVAAIAATPAPPQMDGAKVIWLFPSPPSEYELGRPEETGAMALRVGNAGALGLGKAIKISSAHVLSLPQNKPDRDKLIWVLPALVGDILPQEFTATNPARPQETDWIMGSTYHPQSRGLLWAVAAATAVPVERTRTEDQSRRVKFNGAASVHSIPRRNWCRVVRIMSECHINWVMIGDTYWLEMLKSSDIDVLRDSAGYQPDYPHSVVKAPNLGRLYAADRERYLILHKFRMPDLDDPRKDFWTASFAPLKIDADCCMCNRNGSNPRWVGDDAKNPLPVRSPYLTSSGHDSVACQTKGAPHIIAAPSPCINLTEYDVIRARTLDRAYPSIEMMARVQKESVTFNRLINKPDDWRPPANAREADR